ncbi:MAG: low-specificity L-threonine aldolase [Pseudomonadota bacterium]
MIDLRSDTVTRPTAAMRKVMADAEVGDDVYGDDPTVRALEERVADMLGKQDALFVASGTQSNLIAMLSHCGRGDEYIGGTDYHISSYEQAGAAVLGGISPRHLREMADGCLDPTEIAGAVQADDPHFAVTRLLCLENTHHGRVVPQGAISAATAEARKHDLSCHLDGARLMNAVVGSGRSAKELAQPFDTVSLCLSKGLGAPVGSVLSGPSDFIKRARRNRKLVGGGMRQAGVLAACGLHALNHHVERLAEDHENATVLCGRLSSIDGIAVETEKVETNMVWLQVNNRGSTSLADHMKAQGIVMSNPYGDAGRLRLVTHLDFDKSQIDRVVDGFASWMTLS